MAAPRLPDMTFAGGAFDRAAHHRTEGDHERALASPDARVIVIGEGPAIALRDDGTLERRALDGALDPILLGIDADGAPLLVAAIAEADGLTGLRQAVAELSPGEAALAAYATALVNWQRTARHCGRCGAATEAAQAGHSRRCPVCGLTSYPRTDPVVTMVVEAGDHCLLTRRRGAIPNMWSALAGFVEPGETPEEAVAREAFEEVGVRVTAADYVGAQPWPFPGALMLGFRALADSATDLSAPLEIEQAELHDARWWQRDELRAALGDGAISIPPPLAIGHHLIRAFIDRE